MTTRTIVLGAAGFIGRHLCRRLDATGENVLGFDVVSAADEPVESRALDVTNEAPDCAGADAVIYLSQSPHYRDFAERGDHLFEVNVTGALRAAVAARQAGVKTFLYASTGSVYAPSFAPLREDAPVRRDDPYALSKITAENALDLIDSPMRVAHFRLFGAFGPDQRTMLVPAIIGRVQRGDPITLERNPEDPSDEDGLRISLTFVDDVVDCLVALRDRAIAGQDVPGVVNVAAPEAISMRRLGGAIAEHLGIEPRFELLDRPRSSDFIADTTLLESLIEARFTDFDTAIGKTVASL
ncbi:MAG: NAD-dependent epimerase/dehydratase family protein [Planctomycetes bacterium]|nr:NAD-dependent epimerase/dehydratase family protein [Planctomycetota bacterium]